MATERTLQLQFNTDHCLEVNMRPATSIITYST